MRRHRPDRLLQPAARRDAHRLAVLWTRAFPDRRTAAERTQQLLSNAPYGGIDDSWMVEREGRVVAACRLHHLSEFVAGATLRCLGVAGVAVASTARRQGLGAALCRDALRLGRDAGDVVSVLYPFRPDFYRALGWGYVGELRAYRVATAALPLDAAALARTRLADGDEDRAAMEACYARVAEHSHGPIRRSRAVWDHHLSGAAEAVLALEPDGGAVRGYALVRYPRESIQVDRALRVQELVARDEAARHALWAWVAAQRDQRAVTTYDALPDEAFELRLSSPRPPRWAEHPARRLWTPTARLLRGPMLRVLDVPAALGARRWGAVAAGGVRLRVEVRDAELPGNVGPWTVEVEAGAAAVTEGPCAAADAALTCDAAVFAAIWAGEVRASDAARLGLAEVEDPERLLDDAFAVPRSFWLPDAF